MHDGNARRQDVPARADARLAERGRGAPAREHSRTERERSRAAREQSRAVRAHGRALRGLLPWPDERRGRWEAPPAPRDGSLAPAELAGRLAAAQEEERRRISLELHDGVSQRIAAACIALGRLGKGLPAPAAAEVRGVLDLLIDVSAEVRHISHAMHPPVLELVGLAAALRQHCAELHRLARLEVEVEVAADALSRIPREVGLCLYRVAQEALGNVAAHSGGRRALLRVFPRAGAVELEVRDAGRGFDPARASGGLGLAGMGERVRRLGGTFVVESRVGAGTRVRARLPVDPAPFGQAPRAGGA